MNSNRKWNKFWKTGKYDLKNFIIKKETLIRSLAVIAVFSKIVILLNGFSNNDIKIVVELQINNTRLKFSFTN